MAAYLLDTHVIIWLLEEIFEHLKKLDIEFLSIQENHLVTLLIISQSKTEKITLMSKDSIAVILDSYPGLTRTDPQDLCIP